MEKEVSRMTIIGKPIPVIPVIMCGANKFSHHCMRAFNCEETDVVPESTYQVDCNESAETGEAAS